MMLFEKRGLNIKVLLTLSLLIVSSPGYSYDSGSNGTDGVFNPVLDVELALPLDGIFNFTEVNIPSDVTVTFSKNTANTAVVWLVQNDVVIDGVIDVSASNVGTGEAGPGGFRGGAGGISGSNPIGDPDSVSGGSGQGAGGGGAALDSARTSSGFYFGGCSGGGAGHSAPGQAAGCSFSSRGGGDGGVAYGRASLIPLLGGSGGGGGAGSTSSNGGNGGGGGGAILIAASGSILINGSIFSNGGVTLDAGNGGCGGHGSGGSIRLVATGILGEGAISAISGVAICSAPSGALGAMAALGSAGRIRLEAESLLRNTATSPAYTTDFPQPLFVPDFPQLLISTIGGVMVPVNPLGINDVVLPVNTANPINITFTTSGVPLASIVSLRIVPIRGIETTVLSSPITGTLAAGSTVISANIPGGSSTLIASAEFIVDAQASRDFAPYAEGQLVARIRTSYDVDKGSITTFITKDGNEFPWPSNAIGIN